MCECWGAQGGHTYFNGDGVARLGRRGGYTKGTLSLSASTPLYVYVGQKGINSEHVSTPRPGGWNGGGKGTWDDSPNDDDASGSGGGATDIRLISGNWDNFSSLKSRIMVAGGGCGGNHGSADTNNSNGSSDAGGLEAYYNGPASLQATQTSGYKFGIGQDGSAQKNRPSGGGPGGGGGYYGGGNDSSEDDRVSSGSSFISGHTGCNAIKESSTSSSITHSGSPNHYSGKVFSNTLMIDGRGYEWKTTIPEKTRRGIPKITGSGTEYGHTGDGYCKITWHPAL